jgi:Tol biopolymer transport system component
LEREIPTKLPSARKVLGVVWSSDGKYLLYGNAAGANSGLKWTRSDGSADPQVLASPDGANPSVPHYLSPDGKLALFVRFGSGPSLWSITLDTSDPEHPTAGEPQPVGPTRASGAAISRDGHWLAYSAGATGAPEVFVRPFRDGKVMGEGMVQISFGGGAYPLWSKSANQLLYITTQGQVMVVDYTAEGQTFRPSRPRPWSDVRIGWISVPGVAFFGTGFRPYDLTPDGRSIISWQMNVQPSDTKVNLHVSMLQYWFDEVDLRVR